MKRWNGEPLSPELQAEIKALEAMSDQDIDYSDAAPIADWSGAVRGRAAALAKRAADRAACDQAGKAPPGTRPKAAE